MAWHFIDPATVYWDDWLLFGVQIATLVFLVIYVWKTWQMAGATRAAAEASAEATRETREARLEALAPRVLVYFGTERLNIAEVIVTNLGAGTASDLRIAFDPPLKASQGSFDANKFFETPKPLVPPGFRIAHGFDTWPSYLGSSLPRSYRVNVSYRGRENQREYQDAYVLDVSAMQHLVSFSKTGTSDIVKQLEKVASGLDSGLKRANESLDTLLSLKEYLSPADRTLRHVVSDLVAAWDVRSQIQADPLAHVSFDALLYHLRTMGLDAYRVAARDGTDGIATAMTRVLQLLHHPAHWTDEAWEKEVNESFLPLREYLAQAT